MQKKQAPFSDSLFEKKESPAPAPDYLGHRSRMREKLLAKGADALSEAELLELILMTALPRRDVKPIAKQLLRQFVTLPNVIHADTYALSQVKGVKESVISLLKLIEGTCRVLLKPLPNNKSVLEEWNQIIDYCRFNLSFESQEHLYLIYLDRGMKIITMEDEHKGSSSRLPVYPQEILKRALNLNAAYVIMVHNHPSGLAQPSREDISQTEDVRQFLENGGIQLYDHLIIAANQFYSFRHNSLIA